VRIIDGLMRRKGKFDAIIVETTGLADPAPVAQTFFVDENVGRKTKLDAVVTVADAKWLQARLKDAPGVKNQIAFAAVILINKTDLGAPTASGGRGAHPRINPAHACTRRGAEIPLAEVLERNASISTASSISSRSSSMWTSITTTIMITAITTITMIMATGTPTTTGTCMPTPTAA
jgi:G3E family GTPase